MIFLDDWYLKIKRLPWALQGGMMWGASALSAS